MVWAVPLSPTNLIARRLTPAEQVYGIRSLTGFGSPVRPLVQLVLYLRHSFTRGYTSIYFEENELSPSLISLSPLSTSHPIGFQPELVRPSIECYFNFSLLMDRSPGFASAATDSCALFRLAFATASSLRDLTLPVTSNSPDHYAKGTRSFLTELPQLVSVRFQVLFHSPPGVLFTFPSRYWFTIGHRRVFSLGRWSSQLQAGFHVPRPTRDFSRRVIRFAYGGITVYAGSFQILRLPITFVTPSGRSRDPCRSHDPHITTPRSFHIMQV